MKLSKIIISFFAVIMSVIIITLSLTACKKDEGPQRETLRKEVVSLSLL